MVLITKETKEVEGKETKEVEDKKKEDINIQTKINIEVKLSRNYNTVTIGIQDEPINSSTEEEFRAGIRKKAKILREEAELQLSLIGKKPEVIK